MESTGWKNYPFFEELSRKLQAFNCTGAYRKTAFSS
jgi:hypothetical protein